MLTDVSKKSKELGQIGAVKILSCGIDRFEKTVLTQIRQLIKEPSDLGLYCLSFHLQLLDKLLHCIITPYH